MTPDTQAARQVQLLVVDTQGRLLLKREASPPHWTLLGSALAHDEDYPAAAIRLLFEEAGLTCPLGPLLRQRAHTAKAGQTGEERFFLVRCPDTQLDTHDNAQGRLMLDDSRDATPCYAWWPLSEIQSSESDTFAPSWLPELLASVRFSEMMMPTSAARL